MLNLSSGNLVAIADCGDEEASFQPPALPGGLPRSSSSLCYHPPAKPGAFIYNARTLSIISLSYRHRKESSHPGNASS